MGKPAYVTEIDAEKNVIVVGSRDDLNVRGLIAGDVNWIKIAELVEPISAMIKIRYNDSGKCGMVYPEKAEKIRVVFDDYHSAVTPGQSVVFFDGDEVIGGGVIEEAIK